jgi:cytochrome b
VALRYGPLLGEEWLEDPHRRLAYLLFGLAGLHVAGAIATGARPRENLVRAMITGTKAAPRLGDRD